MAKSESLRRQRLGDLRRLFHYRYGPVLPDDDAGRSDLHELLLPVSLGTEPARKIKNTIETFAPWINTTEAVAIIDDINRTPAYQRKIRAQVLGERLGVSNAEREALRLWTIRPIDMTPEQLAKQRKAKDRMRAQRRRRAAGARSRKIYLAASLNKQKPWTAQGISRATWFRKRRETARETGPSAAKLTKGEDALVSLEFGESQKGRAGHLGRKEGQKAEKRSKSRKAPCVARTASTSDGLVSSTSDGLASSDKPAWSTPIVTEIPWDDEAERLWSALTMAST